MGNACFPLISFQADDSAQSAHTMQSLCTPLDGMRWHWILFIVFGAGCCHGLRLGRAECTTHTFATSQCIINHYHPTKTVFKWDLAARQGPKPTSLTSTVSWAAEQIKRSPLLESASVPPPLTPFGAYHALPNGTQQVARGDWPLWGRCGQGFARAAVYPPPPTNTTNSQSQAHVPLKPLPPALDLFHGDIEGRLL